MARKNKINPDEGLIPSEYDRLNKEFYNEYFADYFFIKFAITANLIQKSDEILKTINDPNFKITFDELQVDPFKIQKEELIKFGKLELSIMYYHCIETFLRIFLAHINLPPCPWLEISRETDFRKFKKTIKKLSEGKFNFNRTNMTSDESITYIFTGCKQLSQPINNSDITDSLKEWIQWAAIEFLEVYDYNAYKHGLTVTTGLDGFILRKNDDNDPVEKLEEHEESIKIIYKQKSGERWVWKEKVLFTRFDFRSACILILKKLIDNIITVGKFTYLNDKSPRSLFLPRDQFLPSKILKTKYDNPFGAVFEGYEIELSYYKDKMK